MQTRLIGEIEVSVVGLGSNNLGTTFFGKGCDLRETTQIVDAALDAGITFIDTAEEYSISSAIGSGESEQFLGRALGSRRKDVVIATKFLNGKEADPAERGATRIVRAVEDSLRRLNTDYIDLYQQHQHDPDVPIDETLAALDSLVQDGKVRAIGCCNFSGEQIDAATKAALAKELTPFLTAQNRYNLLDRPRQEGVLEACRRRGMKLLPFFPLANGLLTGKYRKTQKPVENSRLTRSTPLLDMIKTSQGPTDERLDVVERLHAYAADHGHTLLELAFSWLASQPMVGSIIAGATNADQVRANAVAASWTLSDSEIVEVAAVASGQSSAPAIR